LVALALKRRQRLGDGRATGHRRSVQELMQLTCRGAKVLALEVAERRVTLGERPVKPDSRVPAIDPRLAATASAVPTPLRAAATAAWTRMRSIHSDRTMYNRLTHSAFSAAAGRGTLVVSCAGVTP